MASRNGRFNVFMRPIDPNKSKAKAEETRLHVQRLADMQRYVDMSNEKLNLLLEVITPLLFKGVIVYVELLDVVARIEELLKFRGINTLIITSKSTQKQRDDVSARFMESPKDTVVLFSAAGSESIDLNSTNELVLYNTPKGPAKFNQTIGRICRGFGEFEEFNIHEIIVEETLDEYKQILLSSKREVEKTILNSDSIPLKQDVGSFDANVLKKVRNRMLWKLGKRKKKP